MPILLLLAGVVILAGVVAVAMGRGGEMTEFATDSVPPALDGVVTAADVAMLRPPSSLWGYNVQATDEALSRIAQVMTERDVEIAVLRQQLAELRAAAGSHPAIAATLLARSKAAAARGDTSGLGTAPRRTADPAPRRVADSVVLEPGSDTGPPDTGPPDTGPPDTGPADNGPAGMGSPGSGTAGSGTARIGAAGASSPAERSAGSASPGSASPGSASPGSASPGSASAGAVSGEAAAGRDD